VTVITFGERFPAVCPEGNDHCWDGAWCCDWYDDQGAVCGPHSAPACMYEPGDVADEDDET